MGTDRVAIEGVFPVYLKKIELTNVKSFDHFEWTLPSGVPAAGWHVLLGDNGSGKSALLGACAAALLGDKEALALRLKVNLADWVTRGQREGRIVLTLEQDPQWDNWSGKGETSARELEASICIGADDTLTPVDHPPSPDRHVWGGGKGWFSAAFGPFRRFTGGSPDYAKLFYSNPKLARHLSIFGEDVALTETLPWLKQLRFEQLEHRMLWSEKLAFLLAEEARLSDPGQKFTVAQGIREARDRLVELDGRVPDGLNDRPGAVIQTGASRRSDGDDLLNAIKAFVNQPDFLPNDTWLSEVNSKEVVFVDGNGHRVPIESLSDGFRSILSMTLELIRQLAEVYGTRKIFSDENTRVIPPGVVLIDEVDVHLHPRWQRLIGPWLTDHFPNIQFLVTTHSPLVCQGAEKGSVTRLPQPGTGDRGGPITGAALNRLVYGDILEALSSGAFGDEVGRSDTGQEKLEQLARLNVKALREGLSPGEQGERGELQEIFGGNANLMETDGAADSQG